MNIQKSIIISAVFAVAFAVLVTPQAYAEIEKGKNFDREVLETFEDGSQKIKWTSHPTRILDNGIYQDYIYQDLGSVLEIKTAHNKIQLNKNSCSFEFFNENNNSLFVDSITPFNSIVDLYSWNEISQITNATCEAYYDENNNSLVAKKYASGIGFTEYKYIFNHGKWKTQLEATNLTSLTNRVFAFDQTIDLNRDIIKFGGNTKNLDNFSTQTFDRTFLENNESKVIEFLNGVNFDFDLGFNYLDSVYVLDTGSLKSKLVFHYMRNNEILLPNETLIIDPTFSDSSFTYDRYLADTNDNNVCDVGSSLVDGTETYFGARTLASTPTDCYRGVIEWGLSGFTGTETVTAVRFIGEAVLANDPAEVTDFKGLITSQPSTRSASQTFTDIDSANGWGSTTLYGTNGVNISFTLNSTAVSDVQTLIDGSSTWIAIGFRGVDETLDTSAHYNAIDTSSATPDPTIEIDYTTIPPPDSIVDLTLDSVTQTTATVSFTPPNLNGENLTTYTFNLSTPQTDNVQDFFGNSTDNPFTFTGLSSGTPYSANATAITEGGGNYTLANVLNFTTYELPDGSLSITSGNIGDTLRLINTITMSDGEPLPLTATAQKVYQNNSLVQTTVISENIPTLGVPVSLDDVWYRITVDGIYEYALAVIVTNDAGSQEIFSSSNVTLAREYNPSYVLAVDSPSTQGSVNATVERFDSEDDLLLHVNRIGVSTGQTWQIECIAQTNSEAAQTKNQTESWQGTWSNDTDTGYFNTTYSGFTNSHAYVTCFNEDELFTLTDFTDSSLALLGIQLFDESYGSMIGVPVGIFFLVMTAGMANKRTAPTFIILVTGIAGTMATIGFFTFEPLVWGLALVTAMLGIFVNQKIF